MRRHKPTVKFARDDDRAGAWIRTLGLHALILGELAILFLVNWMFGLLLLFLTGISWQLATRARR